MKKQFKTKDFNHSLFAVFRDTTRGVSRAAEPPPIFWKNSQPPPPIATQILKNLSRRRRRSGDPAAPPPKAKKKLKILSRRRRGIKIDTRFLKIFDTQDQFSEMFFPCKKKQRKNLLLINFLCLFLSVSGANKRQ